MVQGFDEAMVSMQDWDFWLRLSQSTKVRRIPKRLVVYDDVGRNRISTDRKQKISGLKQLLNKNHSNWSPWVRDFHRARLNTWIYLAEGGKWRRIFHCRAPFASVYFACMALLKATFRLG
jgi:hypothetical protein